MRKILYATTALVALGGVTAASADVSISGYTRFQYDTLSDDFDDETDGRNNSKMSTDYNVWVKADMVSDNGLSYGAGVRLDPHGDEEAAAGDRHYLYVQDDWGKLMLGNYHGPAYTMSLGADWRGTVSAYTENTTYNVFKGHNHPRIIYMTPTVDGFQLGASYNDAGTESSDNEMQYGLNYRMPVMDGHLRFGATHTSVEEKGEPDSYDLVDPTDPVPYDITDSSKEATELGVEFKNGPFLTSLVAFEQEESDLHYAGLGIASEWSGHEVEVAFDATDSLKLSTVYFDAEGEGGFENRPGVGKVDIIAAEYNHLIVGAKYTIAPGLWVSLAHTQFESKGTVAGLGGVDNDGTATRLRLNASF